METLRAAELALTGVSILIVDDDEELRLSYPRLVAEVGATCTVVATLQDARRALKRVDWDVLVLDRCLPDGDAHQALLDDLNAELPEAIVAISGYFTPETEIFAQAAGAVILRKPFSFQDLVSAVQLANSRHRRRVPRESGTVALAVCGGWYITPDGATLVGKDLSLDLTKRERQVLLALWQNRESWLSAEALADLVLGRDDASSRRTIRSHVRRVRDKLAEHGGLIESDRPRGYRWTG